MSVRRGLYLLGEVIRHNAALAGDTAVSVDETGDGYTLRYGNSMLTQSQDVPDEDTAIYFWDRFVKPYDGRDGTDRVIGGLDREAAGRLADSPDVRYSDREQWGVDVLEAGKRGYHRGADAGMRELADYSQGPVHVVEDEADIAAASPADALRQVIEAVEQDVQEMEARVQESAEEGAIDAIAVAATRAVEEQLNPEYDPTTGPELYHDLVTGTESIPIK
ncbi:MAG: hypothetical protein SVU88_00270 [Candidatus Nanohaloarchaea archaeon]|nr:hypothetical protein [Candidatus Nanohaloarchaea archaeon]